MSLYNGGAGSGSLITPNIDQIAKDGVIFENGYAANAMCAPSRASIMTGRYSTRFGFEFTPLFPGAVQLMKWIDDIQDNELKIEIEEKLYKDFYKLPEEVKLIIANMAFNLGITRLRKFKKMFTALNAGDYKTASEEGLDSKWAKQVYNRAKRLMNRLRDIDTTDK